MALIDFSPPAQSWQDYLDSLPPGRTPSAQDIFDRWDVFRYTCPAYPRNGNAQQKLEHFLEVLKSGKCKCGATLRTDGLQRLGKRRAYLGWLAEMMCKEEAEHFWLTVANSNMADLMQFAIVPVNREMLKFLRSMDGGGE